MKLKNVKGFHFDQIKEWLGNDLKSLINPKGLLKYCIPYKQVLNITP